ncbi:MAG: sulfatase [Planctomycetes bacterium]|nr:sulfatase [Planctomycetota bacterium]
MKPNLIVVCCDTFRADIIGKNQPLSFVQTPNLDRLADEGVTFTKCYPEGLATMPVRRCFFTGVRTFPWRFVVPNEGMHMRVGAGWHPIPSEQDTLAEVLHDAGYMTSFVADVFHLFKPGCNFTRGFLSWDFIRGHENDMVRTGPFDRIDLAAHVPDDQANPGRHPTVAQYLLNALDRSYEEDFYAAKVFRSATRWVEDNLKNKPFFLWIDSFSPHEMWDPPRYYADAYFKDESVKDYILPQIVNSLEGRTEADIERTKALYYGFVTFVDRWIGHLFTTLDAAGLWDDTIVMFVSDHGTELMDKGQFSKSARKLYPYTTRLNWVVRHPDGPRGTTCDAWTMNQDLFPTVMNMLGLECNVDDGFDIWPLATGKGEREDVRDCAITACQSFVCVRDDAFAVHMDVSKERDEAVHEVYDLQSDPDEENNVLADHPDIARQAVERVEELTGGLPAQFNEYQARYHGQGRLNARIMNTYAPMRFGKGK